ncbi:MAG: DeoR/GlpR family DNA-binding transcription regulator [Propionibacteriaceae bacterium]|nr:DeoR/GlpR family DNA-binding transcription regulator [Propionibacteriaceae bacterium]
MTRRERLNALMQLLAESGEIQISDAVEALNSSAATIRRDLTYLDSQRLVTRTHGGAIANASSIDLPLSLKSQKAQAEKRRIAQRAADLVPLGSVVALNGGTTMLEVGHALAVRPDLSSAPGSDPALTIVTNAVNVAAGLLVRPYLKVVVTGGVVRPHSYELYGPIADRSIDGLHVDIAILGVNGYHPAFGASAYSDAEASVNSRLAASANTVMIVADSSKIGITAFARICSPEMVKILVTDTGIDPEMRAQIEDRGIDLHVV